MGNRSFAIFKTKIGIIHLVECVQRHIEWLGRIILGTVQALQVFMTLFGEHQPMMQDEWVLADLLMAETHLAVQIIEYGHHPSVMRRISMLSPQRGTLHKNILNFCLVEAELFLKHKVGVLKGGEKNN